MMVSRAMRHSVLPGKESLCPFPLCVTHCVVSSFSSFDYFCLSLLLQDDVTGDGTTSTVLLCGELLRQSERYASEGLHPRILVDGLDIARDAALEFLETFKTTPTTKDGSSIVQDRDLLVSLARTSLETKLDADLAKTLTGAIVDAVQCIAPSDETSEPMDLNRIEVMSMPRKMGTDSRFVNGLVLDHGGRHPGMPSKLENCFIMTCNVTFEYEKTEVQSGFFYSNAEEREKLVESERKWLDERCKQVIDLKRSVCTEGQVCVNDKEISMYVCASISNN